MRPRTFGRSSVTFLAAPGLPVLLSGATASWNLKGYSWVFTIRAVMVACRFASTIGRSLGAFEIKIKMGSYGFAEK